MGDSNGDGDGDGVDGDDPGGNSPSRQGVGTELLSPETRFRWRRRGGTLSWKNVDSFRVFTSRAINRPKDDD